MEPEIAVQTNPGGKRDLLLKILLFVIIPVLVIFIAASAFLLTRKSNPTTDQQSVAVDQELSPWSQADQVSSKPAIPTLLALDSKYKKVQEAIASRDYEAFKSVASSERIWHIDNPKKLINESVSGEAVYETLDPKGTANFERYSPYSILFKAPFAKDAFPIQVIEKEPSTRPDIILVDKETNSKTRIKAIVWKYTVELLYRTVDGYQDQGFGHVSFAWDNNDWKYNGEYWDLTTHTTPLELGDVGSASHTFNVDTTGACSPTSLDVKAGDTVSWQGVTGRIYSVPPSSDYWDSGFLYGDQFFKQFKSVGTYTYLIDQIPNQPEDAKDCIINVK